MLYATSLNGQRDTIIGQEISAGYIITFYLHNIKQCVVSCVLYILLSQKGALTTTPHEY
jgi:hypothetical protein